MSFALKSVKDAWILKGPQLKRRYVGLQLGEARFCFHFCLSFTELTCCKLIFPAVIFTAGKLSLGLVGMLLPLGNRRLDPRTPAQRKPKKNLPPAPSPARRKEDCKVLLSSWTQGLATRKREAKGLDPGTVTSAMNQNHAFCSSFRSGGAVLLNLLQCIHPRGHLTEFCGHGLVSMWSAKTVSLLVRFQLHEAWLFCSLLDWNLF